MEGFISFLSSTHRCGGTKEVNNYFNPTTKELNMTNKPKKVRKFKLPRSIQKMYPKVEYAIDAHAPVHVSVNAKDCTTAEPLNPMECALARATKRELKVDGVIIGLSTSYIIKGNKATRFATPMAVQRELVSFDRHSDFAPGDYHLIPKPPSNRFGKDTHKSNRGGKNKSATRKVHTSARVRVLPKGPASA